MEKKSRDKLNFKIVIPIIIAIVIAVTVIVIVIINKNNSSIKESDVKTITTYASSMAEICANDYKSMLKDPDSLKVYSSSGLYKNDKLEYILLDVGAKNSFGGMVRDYILYNSMGQYVGSSSDSKVKSIISDKKYTVLSTLIDYDEWKKKKDEEIKTLDEELKTFENLLKNVD